MLDEKKRARWTASIWTLTGHDTCGMRCDAMRRRVGVLLYCEWVSGGRGKTCVRVGEEGRKREREREEYR